MNRSELNKLSKSELIEKLLKFEVELKKLKTPPPPSPPSPPPSTSPSHPLPKTYQKLHNHLLQLNFYELTKVC